MRYTALLLAALFVSGASYAQEADTAAVEGQERFTYTDIDANEDGMLDNQEFNASYEESGLYDEWDADGDGTISEEEFGDGMFDYYDVNDSGTIEEDEWDEEWYDVW